MIRNLGTPKVFGLQPLWWKMLKVELNVKNWRLIITISNYRVRHLLVVPQAASRVKSCIAKIAVVVPFVFVELHMVLSGIFIFKYFSAHSAPGWCFGRNPPLKNWKKQTNNKQKKLTNSRIAFIRKSFLLDFKCLVRLVYICFLGILVNLTGEFLRFFTSVFNGFGKSSTCSWCNLKVWAENSRQIL